MRLSGISVVAFLLGAVGTFICQCQAAEGPAYDVSKSTSQELKLSIHTTDTASFDSLRIHVTFENLSDHAVMLNLGQMLGNGKRLVPSAVHLVLESSDGKVRKLEYRDPHPGIGGRIDDYIVPLAAGASHSLKLSLKEYWCPQTKEHNLKLFTGQYKVRAEFNGREAEYLNSDTQGLGFMQLWMGKLRSTPAKFKTVLQD